jgi:hypothetical protein
MRAYCRTELMKMACISLYYNPQGAMQSMEQLQATQQIFQTLFTSLSETQPGEEGEEPMKTHFRGLHDQVYLCTPEWGRYMNDACLHAYMHACVRL